MPFLQPFLLIFESLHTAEILVLVLGALIITAAAFWVGGLWMRLRHHKDRRRREDRMFQIEKSLADFFEHEKSKLIEEKEALERDVQSLEKRVEEYRRKAAGVGGRFSKDARSDLLLNLLVENEALQEKLFQEHAHQKEERDRNLERELSALSYQRVLLSRLLEQRNVKEAVVEILSDERKLQELQAGTPRLQENAGEERRKLPSSTEEEGGDAAGGSTEAGG